MSPFALARRSWGSSTTLGRWTPPLTQALLDRLTEIAGCDLARYKEIDLAKRIEIAYVPCTAEVRAIGFDDAEMTDQEWDDFFEEPCNRATRCARSGLFSFSELVSRGRVRAGGIRVWEQELGLEGCVDRMWIGIPGPSYAGVALDRVVGPSANGIVFWHACCSHT